MSEHTPTPYRYSNKNWRNEVDPHNWYITGNYSDIFDEDDDGNEVGEPTGETCVSVAIVPSNSSGGDIAEKTAAFIVRAANAHDKLVAAVKLILKRAAEIGEPIDEPEVAADLVVIRDALALAEPLYERYAARAKPEAKTVRKHETDTMENAPDGKVLKVTAEVECGACGFVVKIEPVDPAGGPTVYDAIVDEMGRVENGSVQGNYILCRSCTVKVDQDTRVPSNRTATRDEVREVLDLP